MHELIKQSVDWLHSLQSDIDPSGVPAHFMFGEVVHYGRGIHHSFVSGWISPDTHIYVSVDSIGDVNVAVNGTPSAYRLERGVTH